MKTILIPILVNFIFLSQTLAQIPSYIPSGMAAYYGFNNNSHDASGNGQDLGTSGVTFTQDRYGVANRAAHFNGASENLHKFDFPGNPAGYFTISA